jgi:S-formylglutathione hydrolase
VIAEHACFEGMQRFLAHASETCHTDMKFSVFEPPQARRGPVPVLYYLAGSRAPKRRS